MSDQQDQAALEIALAALREIATLPVGRNVQAELATAVHTARRALSDIGSAGGNEHE